MAARKLGDVNDDLVKTGEFLEHISKPTNMMCIQKFNECQDIIKWIQTISKGPYYSHFILIIHVFVQCGVI